MLLVQLCLGLMVKDKAFVFVVVEPVQTSLLLPTLECKLLEIQLEKTITSYRFDINCHTQIAKFCFYNP